MREAKPWERQLSLLIFFVTLAVYGLTMCRTIYTGDDGDFETAMVTGGIPHPSGYPLFTLLGRCFLIGLQSLLAEPAMRINLMTACLGAGAVAFFFRFLCVALESRRIAACISLLLAFAPTLWQQSLSCEVYTLTAICLSVSLWLIARLARGEQTLLPLTIVFGLGLTNNLTMALFLPGFLGVALWKLGWRGLLRPAPIAGFLAPLALYAYLPIAAKSGKAPVLWGDPQTPAAFWDHVSGVQYRVVMFSQPLSTWGGRLWHYLSSFLAQELGITVCLLALVGLWWLGKRRNPMLWVTVWVFVANVVWATNYAILDIYVYYIPSYFCVAFWAGAGATAVWQLLTERLCGADARLVSLARVGTLVAVLLPLVSLSQNYVASDKSGNYLEADFSQNILASAPENALILNTGSTEFTLWYRKYVRGERRDVVPISLSLYLGNAVARLPWYENGVRRIYPKLPSGMAVSQDEASQGGLLHKLVTEALQEGRPVLFVADARGDSDASGSLTPMNEQLKPFVRVPWGIAERLYLPGTEPDKQTVFQANTALWPNFVERGVYTGWAQADPFQVHLAFRYFDANKAMGQLAASVGQKDLARQHYQKALNLYGDPEIDKALSAL